MKPHSWYTAGAKYLLAIIWGIIFIINQNTLNMKELKKKQDIWSKRFVLKVSFIVSSAE